MEARSFYVLAYDISADRRRAKIAKLMEAMGARVQGSVFEAYLNAAELEKVLKKAGKLLKINEDSLRIYLICEACRSKIRILGAGKVNQPPGIVIV